MTEGTMSVHGAAAEPRSLDLRECWHIVRRRWVLILAVTLIGAIAGAGYALVAGQKYAATSQVVVLGINQGPGASNGTSSANPQANMSTEQAIAQSPPVVAQAAKIIGVQSAALQAEAAKRLTVMVPASPLTTSNVLQLTWTAPSPRAAQTGANAFASAYLSYRHRGLAAQIASLRAALNQQVRATEKQIARLTLQLSRTTAGMPAHERLTIQLSQLTSQADTASRGLAALVNYNDSGGNMIGAALPTARSGLSHKVIAVLGALLGLLIGLVLAFVRDAFDDRVRDQAQLERSLGAPMLAVLPPTEKARGDGRDHAVRRQVPAISIVANPDGRAAEAVRALRATLAAVAERRNLRTILVASAETNVSSGRIAAGIGLALAESGRRVLLVAADMRGSALPQIFGLDNNAGLGDLLIGGSDANELIRRPEQADGVKLPGPIARRLEVLPNGTLMPHALSVLDSGAMVGLLHSQREVYDFVLLDSPSATAAADVYAIAGQVDAVIVVARAASTRGRTLEELRRRLDQVGAVVVGGVFIGSRRAGRHRHGLATLDPAVGQSLANQEGYAVVPEPPPAQEPTPAAMPLPDVPDDAASGTAGRSAKPS